MKYSTIIPFVIYLEILFQMIAMPVVSFGMSNKGDDELNHLSDTSRITIEVEYKEAQPGDTLWLILDNILISGSPINANLGKFAAVETNDHFKFVIPVEDSCGYWELYKKRTFSFNGGGKNSMPITIPFFWYKGDSISLQLSHKETYAGIYSHYYFTGRGAAKYNAYKEIDSIIKNTNPDSLRIFDEELHFHDKNQAAIKRSIASLHKYKNQMATFEYNVLLADILCYINVPKKISDFYNKNLINVRDSIKTKFLTNYFIDVNNKAYNITNKYNIPKDALLQSKYYLYFSINRFKYGSYFLNKGGYDTNWIYNAIFKNTKGILRDKLLLMLFTKVYLKFTNIDSLYGITSKVITDKKCIALLKELKTASNGIPFTNFSLPDVDGNMINLTDLKGKVVLLDFWFNGCGYCAQLYKETLSKIERNFKDNKKVVFVSINADMSRNRWIDGIKSGFYTSTMNNVINLYTEGKGDGHPLIIKNHISGLPFIVLISQNGIIVKFNSPDLYTYNGLKKDILEERRKGLIYN